ncbi:hypothetical protein FKO01_20715 [Mesorhizobium sp. B2-3-3]|nr:hypothetical protein FKO01_20715 [Mesorhizobium sp. B2-3-3]
MRFPFVLILMAGIGIGLIYPWAMTSFSGREIGAWRVSLRFGGGRPENPNSQPPPPRWGRGTA